MLKINTLQEYKSAYKNSVENPEQFWENIADSFTWKKRWDDVVNWEFDTPKVEWFSGAQLNITENCIDRHLQDKADKVAILWEPNDPEENVVRITYAELADKVNRCANALKEMGIEKGDRVCLYMPMVPELAIAVLACARLGAIHSVVFAGFSAKALADRINDSD